MPPKKPARIAETAWVVFPKTSTNWRDQTISSISAAAPGQDEDAEDDRELAASDLVSPHAHRTDDDPGNR
jgi:hypothetical protein